MKGAHRRLGVAELGVVIVLITSRLFCCAQRISRDRDSGERTAPISWCAGVTSTACALLRSRTPTSRPLAVTGMPTTSIPTA